MFGGAEGDEKHPKSAALTLLPNSHLTLHLDYEVLILDEFIDYFSNENNVF